MFKKILVPVDGSANSFGAVKKAGSLAEKYNGRVTLLHVIAVPFSTAIFSPELGATVSQNIFNELENEGNQVLLRAKMEFAQTPVSTVLRRGHPAMEIIQESKNGYDLIIMGSRGLGEIKGFLLGSVSDRVVHHAGCTVMVVH